MSRISSDGVKQLAIFTFRYRLAFLNKFGNSRGRLIYQRRTLSSLWHDFYKISIDSPFCQRRFESQTANSADEVRERVRTLAGQRVDVIKMFATGAVLTHGSNPKSIEFTPEELQAAVDEARNFGLRVEAHAHAAEGIKNAIRAGVASIEHATLIDDEGIALAKEHGTYLDMDIYDEECIQDAAKESKTPADFLEHDRDLGEIQRRKFAESSAIGQKALVFMY